jgi:hypothetical protein
MPIIIAIYWNVMGSCWVVLTSNPVLDKKSFTLVLNRSHKVFGNFNLAKSEAIADAKNFAAKGHMVKVVEEKDGEPHVIW